MDPDELRAAVWGWGALGTHFAVLLADAGASVTLVSSRVDEPAERTLRIVGRRPREATVRVAPWLPEEDLDAVVVTTRAREAVDRATAAVDHLGSGGVVVPAQNGLVSLDVADAVGAACTVPMVVGFNAGTTDSRSVEVTSPGGVTLGPLAPEGEPTARTLEEALRGGLPVHWSENPRGAVWSKWTISCGINALAVVTGDGVGPLVKSEVGRVGLLSLVTECVALAQARGVALERVAGPLKPDTLAGRASGGFGGWFRQLVVRLIGLRYRSVVPSSLDALRAGRDTEMDELAGRAVALGDELGVDVPWNRAVLEVAGQVEAGKREPGWQALEDVAALAR